MVRGVTPYGRFTRTLRLLPCAVEPATVCTEKPTLDQRRLMEVRVMVHCPLVSVVQRVTSPLVQRPTTCWLARLVPSSVTTTCPRHVRPVRLLRGDRDFTVVGVAVGGVEPPHALGTRELSVMLTLPPDTVKLAPSPMPYSANASQMRQSSDYGAARSSPSRISM